jgi:hypothetical protein
MDPNTSSSREKETKAFLGSENFGMGHGFGRIGSVVKDFLPDSDCQYATTMQKKYTSL